MTLLPTSQTMRRLAIAKEMYLQGITQGERNSITGAVHAILNFDYAVETLMKAVLLDNNIPLSYKGGAGMHKHFDTLKDDILKLYSDAHVVSEITTLHNLRNDVQHNTSIPSNQDINRHRLSVRAFFDGICSTVYGGKVTFDSISLAFLVNSKVGQIIFNAMEEAIFEKRYSDAVFYAQSVTNYHVKLLRAEIGIPFRMTTAAIDRLNSTSHSADADDTDDQLESRLEKAFAELDDYTRDLERVIDWVVNKLPTLDYQYEINELFGDDTPGYPLFRAKRAKRGEEDAQKARTLAYHIVTGIQGMLKKHKDSVAPYLIDYLISTDKSSVTAFVGFASVMELKESRLALMLVLREDFAEHEFEEIKTIELDKTKIFQTIKIDGLEAGKKYELEVILRTEEGDAWEGQSFELD